MKSGYWPAFGEGLQPWGSNGVYTNPKPRRAYREPADKTRKTPRHGVAVPNFSTKPKGLIWGGGSFGATKGAQWRREHLALIDAAIDIADAISNGNGEPVPSSVDKALMECDIVVTPTVRQNIINYLETP